MQPVDRDQQDVLGGGLVVGGGERRGLLERRIYGT
jgi:hypothetical protein